MPGAAVARNLEMENFKYYVVPNYSVPLACHMANFYDP